jgi:hypothetical protein
MDTKSLHTLEYHKVLNLLAGYTSFSAGEELARKLQPTTDQILAEQWQKETAEALLLLDTHTNITIGGARDVRRPAENSKRGFTLLAEDLLNIRSTLVAARTLKRQLIKVADAFPYLAAIAELVEEVPGLVDAISSTIDERGEVLDSASPKLGRIRAGFARRTRPYPRQAPAPAQLQPKPMAAGTDHHDAKRPLRRARQAPTPKAASRASCTTRAAAAPRCGWSPSPRSSSTTSTAACK